MFCVTKQMDGKAGGQMVESSFLSPKAAPENDVRELVIMYQKRVTSES